MEDTPKIDAHAHVWDRTCTMVPGARYHPDYEATIDDYLRILDAHDIEMAVLVQPSFLGTDNRYLLDCLKAHPSRLRGIVVLEPGTPGTALDDMTTLGVIGMRYNLLSLPPMWLSQPEYQILTSQAVQRNWWIEVQANGPDWPFVLQVLSQADLMIDHFGKPSDVPCPGWEALLTRNPTKTCIKLSAPYRQQPFDLRLVARRLIKHYGADRCLWGSDWPWTQHEDAHSYAESVAWLHNWTETADRRVIGNRQELLGFGSS
ncbi:MAG: amidohydrolase family protein [Pseudomonadota bacterium]